MCVCRWLANGQNPQSVLVTAARSDNDLAQENERLRQQLAGQGQRSVYFGGGGLFMMSEVSEDRSFKVQREAMERIARGAREGTLRNKLKINSLMNDVLKGGFRTTKGFDTMASNGVVHKKDQIYSSRRRRNDASAAPRATGKLSNRRRFYKLTHYPSPFLSGSGSHMNPRAMGKQLNKRRKWGSLSIQGVGVLTIPTRIRGKSGSCWRRFSPPPGSRMVLVCWFTIDAHSLPIFYF